MTGSQHPLECAAAREAISAHLDGEEAKVGREWLAGHLLGCTQCQEWHATAQSLQRRTRLTLAPTIDHLPDRILTAVAADRAAARASKKVPLLRRYALWARVGLVLIAGVQLWLSIPVLVLGRDRDVTLHPAHELGSFGVALAAGFLFAAWRPAFARGMRPLVGVIALLLILTATEDLFDGRTKLSDEAPHLISLAGFLLLGMLARHHHPENELARGASASSGDQSDRLADALHNGASTGPEDGDGVGEIGPGHWVTGSARRDAIA